ncbi:testis-specific chromodomain protein Y 1 [Nematostella vectensis]|uniref:testis-specific chromodomain protein Y 1 n=1 Tax=Nematostella vectensis TaxID=45351 RepID=UPI00207748A4|nr:testis-specific chromodomain protein Y 1 [Nematostella vectensis]
MAEEKRLREGDGFYRQLNEANSGELLWGGIQKRKKTRRNGDPTFYPVERVVSRQINNGKTQYLLKWTGYSAYESSWVDEDYLSADLVRNFDSPQVETSRLQGNLDRLREAMEAKLKRRTRVPVSIEFHHDCFRYCFSGKGIKSRDGKHILLSSNDFRVCNFPREWDVYLDKNGDGVKISYPVKMKTFLSKSIKCYKVVDNSVVEDKQRMYTEKITFDFIREPFTI